MAAEREHVLAGDCWCNPTVVAVPAREVRVTEARAVEGDLTFRDREELLRTAVRDQFGPDGDDYCYVWVRDLSDEWVAYELEADGECATWKVAYSIDEDTNVVTFTGEPEKVLLKTSYETVGDAAEAHERVGGRVVESRGEAADGGRVYGVQIIAAGTSRNGVRYTESVLSAAAPLYEGAKAFDHHRTEAELRSSSIAGLVGHYRNVAASPSGIFADLHLLPSATHTAEALDASLEAQAAGLAPVVGISHDVALVYQPAVEGGRRIREATAITSVLSADVVADPSAGGRVTRMVAGGIGPDTNDNDQEVTVNFKQLMELLRKAKPEERAELLKEHAEVLETAGFTAEDVPTLLGEEPSTDDGDPAGDPATEPEGELVATATESTMGRMLIRAAVTDAGLPESFTTVVAEGLGARFTEADLKRQIGAVQRVAESVERGQLGGRVPHVQGGADVADKKRDRLLATFEGRWQEGYTSIHEAYVDIAGGRVSDMFGPDFAAEIVVESNRGGRREGVRHTESLTTGSWGEILADVMNKRVVAEYARPALQAWKPLVTTAPVGDFRSQKLVRMGGYGVLPTVSEGAPYQPLTSPGDEQATYTPTKKGGTEDFTYEMAKNDDLKKLVAIPKALGRAAGQTLYRAVFDLLANNSTIYDSVALFDAGHSNTNTSAGLAQSTLSTGRATMRAQAAYGDSYDVLGLTPKFLVVPPELEEIAFQLASSAVAIPSTPAGPSNTPNIHQGLSPVVVDYWSDANDWFLVADPETCPTIEVGFLDGRVDPETFVQDDPTVGSAFSADKVTWKIRHIWGLAVLDYRGFYRGQG